MQWRLDEPVVRIELFCALVQRVDEQGAHAGVLRNRDGSQHRVLQQGCAELDALGTQVDRQPGQDSTGIGSDMFRRTPLVAS